MVYIVVGLIACILLLELVLEVLYRRTSYFKITKNSRLTLYRDKGKKGEYRVWEKLRDLEKSGTKFLFNLYLPREAGGTTEIDVLLLNQQGVFVIESKNYSGWIFGNEKSKYWTQTLPAGRRRSHKEHFLNPIFQNDLHVRCLKKVIGDGVPLRSIIVFSDQCELKKLQVDMSGIIQVVKLNSLPTVIKMINWGAVLSSAEIEALFTALYPYSQVSPSVKQAHIAEIQAELQKVTGQNGTRESKAPVPTFSSAFPSNDHAKASVSSVFGEAEMQSEMQRCPQCGGRLILRTAKNGKNAGGKFYGCSNFPKCRYTKPVKRKNDAV